MLQMQKLSQSAQTIICYGLTATNCEVVLNASGCRAGGPASKSRGARLQKTRTTPSANKEAPRPPRASRHSAAQQTAVCMNRVSLLPMMLSRSLASAAAPAVAKGLNGVVADVTRISSVGGNHDGLTYRGYPVEQLCTRRFEDTAHLLLHGRLPETKDESDRYVARLAAKRRAPQRRGHTIFAPSTRSADES